MSENTITTMTPSTLVARSQTITSAPIGQETAMLNIEQGKYYGLDDIGSEIWELLEKPRTVEQICAQLLARYDVDAEACQQQVIAFLQELVQAGVVDVIAA